MTIQLTNDNAVLFSCSAFLFQISSSRNLTVCNMKYRLNHVFPSTNEKICNLLISQRSLLSRGLQAFKKRPKIGPITWPKTISFTTAKRILETCTFPCTNPLSIAVTQYGGSIKRNNIIITAIQAMY